MKTQRILTIALLEAALVCSSSIAAVQTQNAITAGDWPSVNHDANGSRYSALKEIDSTNVGALNKAGTYTFPDKEPSQTAPVVIDGVIYATTAHTTVALDGFDCHVIWTHKWVSHGVETFNSQRGVAIADGKVVRGTPDGYLIALDMKDGHLIWEKQIADSKEGYFISMPPLINNGLIYIGPAGAEWASSGWVGAFRLSDGERVWRFNIIPGDGEKGADTWGPNPETRKHAGGNLWTALSLDVEKGILYVPGGNPAPDIYDDERPGDNLYTDSLIALDAKTGRLKWYKQFIPHDVHDYDMTHVRIIKTGKHTLLAATGKDGLMRMLDADSHKIVYTVPFTSRMNTEAPLTTNSLRVSPGTLGGNEWNGPAYSPALGTIFVPATDWSAKMKKDTTPPDAEKEHIHGWFFGGETEFDPWEQARGWLTAFDVATGKTRWVYPAAKPLIGAVTATAGNLVLTGELTGDFLALDAASGKVLYRKNVGGPIGGGIVTYNAHNVQNVAVVSGFLGIFNKMAPTLGGGNTTITVFRLSQ
jgi:alcohol dehydrogenase (cytochrome c)